MNRPALPLIALLLLLIIPFGIIQDLRGEVLLYVLLAASATLLLYIGAFTFQRTGTDPGAGLIIAGAILLRLAVFPAQPSLSDDAWRYLWDGRLVAEGRSPYEAPPADSTFSELHDYLYEVQGYPETNTIYPPGVQLWFAGAVSFVSPATRSGALVSYFIWKGLLVLAEIAGIILLLVTLRRLGRPLLPLILYAWHPLAVMEITGQGHTDGLWVLALALACYGFVAGRGGGGLPGLGFGAAVRLFPVLIGPLWLRFLSRRAKIAGVIGSLPFLLLLLILLDPDVLHRFGEVAVRFTDYYEFNGGIYYGIKEILDLLHLKPSNLLAGRITTGLLLASVATITLWPIRNRDFRTLLIRVLAVITLQIALTAKSHIWYGVAPLALITLDEDGRFRPLWLWLTLMAPFTYLYYAATPPAESTLVLWLEWGGGAVVWLGSEIWRRRRSSHTEQKPEL